jgi:glycerophosphoryl diester phosphodiesterase
MSGNKIPTIIAHRGGRKWAPENTLAAFTKSLEAGVYGIELDIHRCATGELVVIHDDDLARTTNGTGLVKDASLDELRRLSAGLWFAPEFHMERIPLLQEVLDLIQGKLVINIEIKNTPIDYPNIEDDLLSMLKNYKWCDKIIVSSFDHKVLKRLHAKAPQINIGMLGVSLFVDLADYADKMGAKFFHPALDSLRRDAIDDAHKANIIVNTWTVNDIATWTYALEIGVDGIITDDPVGLKQFLDNKSKLKAKLF